MAEWINQECVAVDAANVEACYCTGSREVPYFLRFSGGVRGIS